MISLKMTKDKETTCKDVCLDALPSFPGTVFLDASVEFNEEPEAPTVSLGEKVVWLKETAIEIGTMKWIGRIPFICSDWTAGVEFDNPIGHGNGAFNGRRYFRGKENHIIFMPMIGLLRQDDYIDDSGKAEIVSVQSVAGTSSNQEDHLISEVSSLDIADNLPDIFIGDKSKASNHTTDLTEKKKISSFLSRSLQRPHKRRTDKRTSVIPSNNQQNDKLKNLRKISLNSVSSCPTIIDDGWPVIDSDSEIDYKSGIHVLMSCFTLGASYRRKKTNATSEYLEKKTDVFISCPNDREPQKFVAEQSDEKEIMGISKSVSNVSNEVACCSSLTHTLEKNSVQFRKRRKKKRAPSPPHSPTPTTNSLTVNSKLINKMDELPDVIGRLYLFNKTTYQNKQREKMSPQNVSVLCQGRYARIIEEKPLMNDVTSQQTVSVSNVTVVKKRSYKRKSTKKKPAPQPPHMIPFTYIANAGQFESEQNKMDNILRNNESGVKQVHDCESVAAERNYFKTVNINTEIQPISTMNFINIHPKPVKCNCMVCNKGNNTATFFPTVVCPTLPNSAETCNITILGYCNVDTRDRTVLHHNSNPLLHSNMSDLSIPVSNTVTCSACAPSINMIRKHIHGKNCENGAKDSTDSSEEDDDNEHCNVPREQTVRSYQYERSNIDYVSQRMVEERRNSNNYCLDNRNLTKKHFCSSISQNGSTYKKTLLSQHMSAANFCSCSENQWISENSDDCNENYESNYSFCDTGACTEAYDSEISNIPKRKIKIPQPFSELKCTRHEEDGIQELIKSRPSVSDFIAAFNYLTQKTNSDVDITSNEGNTHYQSVYSNSKFTNEETHMENKFDLKSLPTKWKYSPVDIVSVKKASVERRECVQRNEDLLPPKRNKNKRVTFKKGTKPENKSSVKLNIITDANSKHSDMLQYLQNNVHSSTANDINIPFKHNISMAHRHACNQQLINMNSKQNFAKQAGISCQRKVVHNGNNAKEIKSYRNSDKSFLRPNQSTKQLGYKKTYRAPPVPEHPVFSQNKNVSSQNKVSNYYIPEENEVESCSNEDQSTHTNKTTDDKIWVSLYIEDKSSHKGLIPLLVSPTMTVKTLKIKLERQFGYPRDLQRWILGKSFATDDNATLANYNVTEAGCPVFLYMTVKNMPYDYEDVSVAKNTVKVQESSTDESESDSDLTDSDSGTVILASDTEQESSESSGTKSTAEIFNIPIRKKRTDITSSFNLKKSKIEEIQKKHTFKQNPHNQNDTNKKSEAMRENYKRWVEIEEKDLIVNLEPFECPVCFLDVPTNAGIMLKDCLHLFCRECLSNAVYYSEEAVIKCPFRNNEYSCDSHLQEREIKALVSSEVYERHLQRSIVAAESQAKNSFHCKSPDCPGWCLYEDKVNLFLCPVCGHLNCLTCQAIHEGRNCRQYQDELEFNSITSDEAKKTKDYLDNMLKEGEAMRCPQCHIILMKKWGCDWLKCSVCLTEVCWVTKGRRWGPAGRGDTSGGCRCGVNGVRCHPKCNYCH